MKSAGEGADQTEHCIEVELEDSVIEALTVQADQQGITLNDLMVNIIRAGFDKEAGEQ